MPNPLFWMALVGYVIGALTWMAGIAGDRVFEGPDDRYFPRYESNYIVVACGVLIFCTSLLLHALCRIESAIKNRS